MLKFKKTIDDRQATWLHNPRLGGGKGKGKGLDTCHSATYVSHSDENTGTFWKKTPSEIISFESIQSGFIKAPSIIIY